LLYICRYMIKNPIKFTRYYRINRFQMNQITSLCFQDIRKERQRNNVNHIIDCITTSNFNALSSYINQNEFSRVLEETQLNAESLYEHCQESKILLTVLAGRIAKNSARQGTKDEQLQIDVCNRFAKNYGITIENLTAFAYRPTKDGRIVSADDIKTQNISKNTCLKSFDARIQGTIQGWIFAKIVFGIGGHQDNVFEEADTLCLWVNQFGDSSHLYVVLIDTDLHSKITCLKEKYKEIKNIFIGNHIEFQQYIQTRFG